jgi:hypothetical protein
MAVKMSHMLISAALEALLGCPFWTYGDADVMAGLDSANRQT